MASAQNTFFVMLIFSISQPLLFPQPLQLKDSLILNFSSDMGALQTSKYNITKIGLASITAMSTGYVYVKLQEINNILGKDIIESAEKQLLADLQTGTQDQANQNIQSSFYDRLENTLSIYQKRWIVYKNRLIYFDTYKQSSQLYVQKVVKPILEVYEEQGVFENDKIIDFISRKGNFNNKFTEEIIKISQENLIIKQKYSHLAQKLLSLQNKLLTVVLPGLSQSNKQKIDLLYEHIKERNISLARALSQEQDFNPQQWTVGYQSDYLSKIQLI